RSRAELVGVLQPVLRVTLRDVRLEDDDLVRDALARFVVRGADDAPEKLRARRIPRDALTANVHGDRLFNLQHRAGVGKANLLGPGVVGTGDVEAPIRTPGAAGVAHVAERIEELRRKHPALDDLPVGVEANDRGARLPDLGNGGIGDGRVHALVVLARTL